MKNNGLPCSCSTCASRRRAKQDQREQKRTAKR